MLHVIDFSFLVICVLIYLTQFNQAFAKFVVEVDLIFCFSIFHNLLIYSGNFYIVIVTVSVCDCEAPSLKYLERGLGSYLFLGMTYLIRQYSNLSMRY